MRHLDGTELKRLHREWRRRTSARLGLVLDGVQSPFNVGAIVRTAAAYRVEELWLLGDGPAPDSDRAGKTAMGTQRYLRWTRHERADRLADAVAAAGYQLIGIELTQGASPLHELDLTGDVCLAVGHEDRGLRSALLERCAEIGYLPQLGRVGSLNVATAAAIALYEARRQAWG